MEYFLELSQSKRSNFVDTLFNLMFHTHKNQQKIYANQQALEVAYYLLILIIESYIHY